MTRQAQNDEQKTHDNKNQAQMFEKWPERHSMTNIDT